jgi:hypothetical protein
VRPLVSTCPGCFPTQLQPGLFQSGSEEMVSLLALHRLVFRPSAGEFDRRPRTRIRCFGRWPIVFAHAPKRQQGSQETELLSRSNGFSSFHSA